MTAAFPTWGELATSTQAPLAPQLPHCLPHLTKRELGNSFSFKENWKFTGKHMKLCKFPNNSQKVWGLEILNYFEAAILIHTWWFQLTGLLGDDILTLEQRQNLRWNHSKGLKRTVGRCFCWHTCKGNWKKWQKASANISPCSHQPSQKLTLRDRSHISWLFCPWPLDEKHLWIKIRILLHLPYISKLKWGRQAKGLVTAASHHSIRSATMPQFQREGSIKV